MVSNQSNDRKIKQLSLAERLQRDIRVPNIVDKNKSGSEHHSSKVDFDSAQSSYWRVKGNDLNGIQLEAELERIQETKKSNRQVSKEKLFIDVSQSHQIRLDDTQTKTIIDLNSGLVRAESSQMLNSLEISASGIGFTV